MAPFAPRLAWATVVLAQYVAGWHAVVSPGPSQLLRRPQAGRRRGGSSLVVPGATVESRVEPETVPPTTIEPPAAAQSDGAAADAAAFAAARAVGEELRASGATRMRFAPSPTGSLHVGGARTALYNWLAAQKEKDHSDASGGGSFLIRIEDTDVARSTRASEDSMLADLEWLGLAWDEGPRVGGPCEPSYRQSERSVLYAAAARALVAQGAAYPCFCTEEELEAKRQKAQAGGRNVAYDGAWRDADPAEVQRRLDAGEPHTIRFKAPKNHVVAIDDAIRGRVEWDVEATIGDFILLRSSGVPVYNFCVAVDDALMGVSTVVRAEEHLTNTVRQLLVLEALGFPAPRYAHASLILGSDRSKLSKRHGATSCGQFRKKGYLADAMVNYLALLGWNDGTDKEVYSRADLIDAFSVDRVVPSPAMFDEHKLRWINGQHLRAMAVDDLAALCVRDGFFDRAAIEMTPDTSDDDSSAAFELFASKAVGMAQPKADLVTDVVEVVRDALAYPLRETLALETEAKNPPKQLRELLDDGFASFALDVCASYDRGDAPSWCYDASTLAADDDAARTDLDAWLRALGAATGRSKKRLFLPARLALTGRLAGPDVPAQLETLAAALKAGIAAPGLAPLDCRLAQLKQWAEGRDGARSTIATEAADETAVDAPRSSEAAAPATATTTTTTTGPPISFDEFKKLRKVYEAHRRTLDEDPKAMYDVLVAAYDRLRH